MEYFVIALMVLVVVGLLVTMLRVRKNDYQTLALGMAKKQRKGFQVLRPCPLCGGMLRKGETVKTKVTELAMSGKHGANKLGVKESLADVFGCPYCWPHRADKPRKCPACRATLGPTDHVVARYFEKEAGRNHLHVLGCTICRKKVGPAG